MKNYSTSFIPIFISLLPCCFHSINGNCSDQIPVQLKERKRMTKEIGSFYVLVSQIIGGIGDEKEGVLLQNFLQYLISIIKHIDNILKVADVTNLLLLLFHYTHGCQKSRQKVNYRTKASVDFLFILKSHHCTFTQFCAIGFN